MKYIIIASLSGLMWVTPAYAYLDPSTGSIIIQSAIAAIAGAYFVIKTYWYRIKDYFSRKNTNEPNDLNKEEDED